MSVTPRPRFAAAAALLACLSAMFLGCAARDAAPRSERPVVTWRHIETRVNTYTDNRQTQPTLDVNADGEFFVVWGSRRQEHGTYGAFGQRLDPLGRPLGEEIHLNQTVAGMQSDPAVVYVHDGSAWTVWTSTGQDGEARAIVARRFGPTANGFEPLGDEFIVNQTVRGDQSRPVVCATPTGRVLVGWVCAADARPIVRGRIYHADGRPAGDEFTLGQATKGGEGELAVVASGERFATVWRRNAPDNRPDALWARLWRADGRPLGDEFRISPADDGMHIEPSIDADADGGFVVAWMQWRSADRSYAVAYRCFDRDGAARSAMNCVADGPDWRSGATVAVAPDGRFAIAYNIDDPDQDAFEPNRPSHRWTPANVWVRHFHPDGSAAGPPQQLNQYDLGRQGMTIAASGRQGVWTQRDQLAFVWMGRTGQGDKRGVALTLRAPESLHAPPPPAFARRPAARDVTAQQVFPLLPPVYDPNLVAIASEPAMPPAGPDYGFQGQASTGWNPPDPDIAAGPNHVVLVVNGKILFMEHDGTLLFAQAIAGSGGFWGSVGATSFVFDPVALFDPHAQRFVVAAAELREGNTLSYINVAVSDDDNPSGTWHKYRFDISEYGEFFDFPNLGVNRDAVFVAGDFFRSPTGNYIFVIPKAPLLDGAPTNITPIRSSSAVRSLGCVKNYDPDDSTQYFASTFYGSTIVRIEGLVDPLGDAALASFDLTVPDFRYPPDAEQLGSSNRVDTIDVRLKNGVYRNGSLWVSHNVGSDGTARVRWYEIAINGWPLSGEDPTLVQSGEIDLGPDEHNWFSDIHVDQYGNAVLCFNHSSSDQYISIERAIRRYDDPPGEFQPAVLMQESTSPETGDRWGDYGAVDEQPDAPGVFWSHNEYRTSSWRTWVGRIQIDTPDCNANGTPDDTDIADGTSADCNANAVPDECDIATGVSDDCDANGVPDECDLAAGAPDCNANGVIDACDIAASASGDCNANGVPDECDIASGAAEDCNANGVPDACDVAIGTSADCNANAVPDECDLALPPPIITDQRPALMNWVEISRMVEPLGLGPDDVAEVNFPFANALFDVDAVQIANDGGIGFGAAATLQSENAALPSAAAFGGGRALLPYWDDLDADTGDVYAAVVGPAPYRSFIVQWEARAHEPGVPGYGADEATFQVQIHETPFDGVYAQIRYRDVHMDNPAYDAGASATLGYQHDADRASQWSFNQPGAVAPDLVLSLYQPPGPSADVNGNNVPDECEPDCNGNGVPDDWDLAHGPSTDCNGNLTPDVCDLASGFSKDRNNNGVPDECDPFLIGDLNCDGVLNTRDVDAFILALTNATLYAQQYPNCPRNLADCNQDGEINSRDIDSFVDLLTQ